MLTLYPKIAKEWNYSKNKVESKVVSPSSHKKAWWICSRGHSYYSSIANRVREGAGCPICAGKKALAGFNDLATTNPEIVDTWDLEKNGKVTAADILKGSHKKYWWRCRNGHSYFRAVYDQVAKEGRCPICREMAGYIRCLETGEVFKSVNEAAEKIGKHPSSIRKCLKGDSQKCGGFHWDYLNK